MESEKQVFLFAIVKTHFSINISAPSEWISKSKGSKSMELQSRSTSGTQQANKGSEISPNLSTRAHMALSLCTQSLIPTASNTSKDGSIRSRKQAVWTPK